MENILRDNEFDNPDIGAVNDVLHIDWFVLSIPKCGTTTLQHGLEQSGRRVIHAHTDESTFAALKNGNVLRQKELGMAELLQARRAANKRRIHVLFGYRDPVDWFFSLAGHFGMPLDDALKIDVLRKIGRSFPWSHYAIDDIAEIIVKGTGLSVLEQPFDHGKGYGLIRGDGIDVVTYRLDRMDGVLTYLQENLGLTFTLGHERVNADPKYIAFKGNLSMPKSLLEPLYENRWVKHFYTRQERDKLTEFHLQAHCSAVDI